MKELEADHMCANWQNLELEIEESAKSSSIPTAVQRRFKAEHPKYIVVCKSYKQLLR